MANTEQKLRFATRFVLLVLLSAFAIYSSSNMNGVSGQQEAPVEAKQNSEMPDVMSDIDDAIKTLENKDFKRFLDRYAPVELLRQIRQENMVAQTLQQLNTTPTFKANFVDLLKSLQKLKPTFDASHGLATFRYDTMADGPPANSSELHLPDTNNLNLEGLGDDLKKALTEGDKLLSQNQTQQFIERMFPASTLSRLNDPGMMQAMVFQFTAVPEQPKLLRGERKDKKAPITMLQASRDDLQRLLTLSPELTDGGQVAVFRVKSADDSPERIIKFQKVRGNWRYFDGSDRIAIELTRQSKLKPESTVVDVQFELVGGNWRFVDFKSLPMKR